MSEGQRQIKRYGWKPSLPDHRDLLADTTGLTPLPEVDPRDKMPEVFDQGQLGSCTANAVGAALEYDGILDGAPAVTPEPSLHLLLRARRSRDRSARATPARSGATGSRPRAGTARRPRRSGPTTSRTMPTTRPQQVWTDAAAHKLTKYYKSVPRSVNQFKLVLSNQQTMAFGFSVYESFESPAVAKHRHRADARTRRAAAGRPRGARRRLPRRPSPTTCWCATAGARAGAWAGTS